MLSKPTTILFAEDEISLAEIVKECLEERGFTVIHCQTAGETLDKFYKSHPDILVLDVMLPDADGFSLAKQIRTTDKDTPIIFLTSKSLPQDVVNGFESGGNDYLKKPFSIEELVVRIKARLGTPLSANELSALKSSSGIGDYRFNFHSQELSIHEQCFDLTSRENEILKLLLLNKNKVVERKTILMHIWGNDDFTNGRSLDVFITKLRKYLQQDSSVQIANIRGIGYKLIC